MLTGFPFIYPLPPVHSSIPTGFPWIAFNQQQQQHRLLTYSPIFEYSDPFNCLTQPKLDALIGFVDLSDEAAEAPASLEPS